MYFPMLCSFYSKKTSLPTEKRLGGDVREKNEGNLQRKRCLSPDWAVDVAMVNDIVIPESLVNLAIDFPGAIPGNDRTSLDRELVSVNDAKFGCVLSL